MLGRIFSIEQPENDGSQGENAAMQEANGGQVENSANGQRQENSDDDDDDDF